MTNEGSQLFSDEGRSGKAYNTHKKRSQNIEPPLSEKLF